MSQIKHPMTVAGKVQLEETLKKLISEERPAVIKAIEEARQNGDLSENADYDAAKERQGFIEAKIAEIQGKLANAEVVDVSRVKSDTIVFGATISLMDHIQEKKLVYQLVGEDEADLSQGKISIFAPLSKRFIGKKKGDFIEFSTDRGDKAYEVLDFFFK